jgi:hypothetical protein
MGPDPPLALPSLITGLQLSAHLCRVVRATRAGAGVAGYGEEGRASGDSVLDRARGSSAGGVARERLAARPLGTSCDAARAPPSLSLSTTRDRTSETSSSAPGPPPPPAPPRSSRLTCLERRVAQGCEADARPVHHRVKPHTHSPCQTTRANTTCQTTHARTVSNTFPTRRWPTRARAPP